MYLAPEESNIVLFSDPEFEFRVEETLLEQGSGPFNEDKLAVGNGVCIVCDGATGLKGCRKPIRNSGGGIAAEITARIFTSGRDTDLRRLAAAANEEIRSAMVRDGLDLTIREHLWATSFAAVQLEQNRINWCQTGDCMIMVVDEKGTGKLLTTLPGHDNELLQHWQKISQSVKGSIHEVLADRIAEVRRTMNRRFGVLNGEPEALDFLSCGSIETQGIRNILLFSDGFFPPNEVPDQSFDRQKLLELFLDSGLSKVRDHIRLVQDHDPRCSRFPRFKKHDDISAIALGRHPGSMGNQLEEPIANYSGSMP